MKKILLLSCVLLILPIGFFFISYYNKEYKVIESEKQSKTIVNSNALTMMYETEAGSGEYQVTSDTTWPQEGYVFNEQLSACENGSTLTWDDENKRVIVSTSVSDKCYVYFDKEPLTLANYIINEVYTGTDGENGLYYHDGTGTYGSLEAGDDSYRFSGANPNNYVCFGSDATTCPNDNLYRIIGVFGNQVKLIKHDYAGENVLKVSPESNGDPSNFPNYNGSWNIIPGYAWSGSKAVETNIWSNSTLNTEMLNKNYINVLGKWADLIATTVWKVGGMVGDGYDSTFNGAHNLEINNPNSDVETTYRSKIGLMYVTDYVYGATPEDWDVTVFDYAYDDTTNPNNNWIYMGYYDWTISRYSGRTGTAFYVDDYGGVLDDYVDSHYGVRPSFYLNPDVTYISGSGTQSDPFRIA